MTEPRQRGASVTRAEYETLVKSVAEISDQMRDDKQIRADTHAMVMSLHHALIAPEPGHQFGLLHRMASVTIAAETGQAVGERIIWWAKVFAALGVIAGGFWAFVSLGQDPRGMK